MADDSSREAVAAVRVGLRLHELSLVHPFRTANPRYRDMSVWCGTHTPIVSRIADSSQARVVGSDKHQDAGKC